MRIYVHSEEATLWIPVPNFVLCSRLGARIAASVLQQYPHGNVPMDYRTIRAMQKALKACVRTHGHFTLVDVESADGDKVKIVL